MLSKIPAAFFTVRALLWLMLILGSTRTTRSFFAELLSSWMSPSIYWLFLPGTGPCTAFWNLWGSCHPISSTYGGLSGWHHTSLAYKALLPVLHHLKTCLRHILIIQIINESIKQDGNLYWPWSTWPTTGLQLDFVPLCITSLAMKTESRRTERMSF